MKYFIGLIVIIVGSILLIKTEWFYRFTGPISWAEQHLGTEGGTRILYKIIGLLLILGTFLTLTGCTGAILGKIFKSSVLGGPTTISE